MGEEVEEVCQLLEIDRHKLSDRDGVIKYLSIKMQVLADNSQKTATMPAQVAARIMKLTFMHETASQSTGPVEAID